MNSDVSMFAGFNVQLGTKIQPNKTAPRAVS